MAKDKVEVRIAGVLMANKLLEKSTQQPDMVEEITHSILQRVGEGFIVKMLLTCDETVHRKPPKKQPKRILTLKSQRGTKRV
jgi:hypothetical protein